MSRSERLLDLLHILRQHRRPVSGQVLADEIGVSLRTLYRDIASLQAQGANIEGEVGVGYLLKPGYLLPPLMFPPEELEALVLGARWVRRRADARLQQAAHSALSRIAATLPADLADEMEATGLLVGPGADRPSDIVDPVLLRRAIRTERKLQLSYRDGTGSLSTRVIWPFALAYFDQVQVLVGWCELRRNYRSFRTDRIAAADLLDARYPKRRQALMKDWHAKEKRSAASDTDRI